MHFPFSFSQTTFSHLIYNPIQICRIIFASFIKLYRYFYNAFFIAIIKINYFNALWCCFFLSSFSQIQTRLGRYAGMGFPYSVKTAKRYLLHINVVLSLNQLLTII